MIVMYKLNLTELKRIAEGGQPPVFDKLSIGLIHGGSDYEIEVPTGTHALFLIASGIETICKEEHERFFTYVLHVKELFKFANNKLVSIQMDGY